MVDSLSAINDLQLSNIRLCSSIGSEYRRELEELFFFNPRQHVVIARAIQHIERYGTPEIQSRDGTITLGLRLLEQAQALLLMMGDEQAKLVGAALYVREDERLRILFFALNPTYTLNRKISSELMVFVIDSVRNISRRIGGVKSVVWCVGDKDCSFKV